VEANHDYIGNKNLGSKINLEYTKEGTKNLVHKTNQDYKTRNKK
jgi:hypothetical protein